MQVLITSTDIVGRLGGKILEDAVERGAEAVIVACPMCHSNLDMRRKEIERVTGKEFTIPIIYITQAIGLALGIEPKILGLQRHFVPVACRRQKQSSTKHTGPRSSGGVIREVS